MNPNDNKNNKNNKPGGNWRGVASLVGWALLLTIIFSYASSVIGSTGRQASSINVDTESSRRWWRAARWPGWNSTTRRISS